MMDNTALCSICRRYSVIELNLWHAQDLRFDGALNMPLETSLFIGLDVHISVLMTADTLLLSYRTKTSPPCYQDCFEVRCFIDIVPTVFV